LENSFSVDAAYDGEEGLRLALHKKYDHIIPDIMLPKTDGGEVLSRDFFSYPPASIMTRWISSPSLTGLTSSLGCALA